MLEPNTQIRPEGLGFILLMVLVTLVFALLGWSVPAVLGLVLSFLAVNFFRDPERVIPEDPHVAVAPADGRVVRVQNIPDPFTGEKKTAVCIFMNVFNVHVNRFPVSGQVRAIRYHPGKFFNASLDKASKDNERCVLDIVDEEQREWTMVQIAGLLARRIICLAEKGDVLSRGQRFGLIKLGSRVDLYLPADYKSAVKVGDKTVAGQTVIAQRTMDR